jgi:hypothetical protein
MPIPFRVTATKGGKKKEEEEEEMKPVKLKFTKHKKIHELNSKSSCKLPSEPSAFAISLSTPTQSTASPPFCITQETPQKIPTVISKTKTLLFENKTRERERVHLRELVGCTTGDLGDAEEGKIRLEILEQVQQLGLQFLTQLMDLDSRCDIFTNKNATTRKSKAKLKCDFQKHRNP